MQVSTGAVFWELPIANVHNDPAVAAAAPRVRCVECAGKAASRLCHGCGGDVVCATCFHMLHGSGRRAHHVFALLAFSPRAAGNMRASVVDPSPYEGRAVASRGISRADTAAVSSRRGGTSAAGGGDDDVSSMHAAASQAAGGVRPVSRGISASAPQRSLAALGLPETWTPQLHAVPRAVRGVPPGVNPLTIGLAPSTAHHAPLAAAAAAARDALTAATRPSAPRPTLAPIGSPFAPRKAGSTASARPKPLPADVAAAAAGTLWHAYMSTEYGVPFYHNPTTGASTWELPRAARILPMTRAVTQWLVAEAKGTKAGGGAAAGRSAAAARSPP